MIKNNNFYLKNLKNVIFFGYSEKFKELLTINNIFKIKTFFIAGSDQKKLYENKTKVYLCNKINKNLMNFIKDNVDIERTLFISLGARYIFNQKVINFFKNNLINFHCTRLPLDGGGGGYSWKIMREDRIDNQLVHLIDASVDGGPIIDYETSLFPKNCIIPKDFEIYRLNKFINFYKKFIQNILQHKSYNLKTQLDYLGRYNPRLNTLKDGLIDWNMESYDLINFINAFDEPYEGASTFLNNGNFGKLFIKSAQLHGGDSSNHPYMAGIVSRHDKKWLVVSTAGKHMLIIEKVLDKNKKNIISKIKVGDRFFSDQNQIIKSKSFKTRYNNKGLIQ